MSMEVIDEMIRESAGLSVIGRAGNTVGAVADIVAAANYQVLRRSGNTLGFGTIATNGVANDAITQDKVNDDAVGTDQIIDDAVTQDKIANGAVGTNHLPDDAVIEDKLANLGVGTTDIVNSAVTENKIPDNEIITSDFAAEAVDYANVDEDNILIARERQGNNSIYWAIPGDVSYSLDKVKLLAGCKRVVLSDYSWTSAPEQLYIFLNLMAPYGNFGYGSMTPLFFFTVWDDSHNELGSVSIIDTPGWIALDRVRVRIWIKGLTINADYIDIHWLAVGQPQ